MPLDNFYDRSDKAARRSLLFAALAVLLLAGVFYFFFSKLDYADHQKSYQAPPEEAAEDFRKLPHSFRVQRVDALCSSVPKPEKFNFVSKKFAAAENDAVSVVYNYETNRDAAEILTFFTVWFSSRGWKNNGGAENVFSKNGQEISIESRDDYRNSYAIHCSESAKDDAIAFTDKDI
jgi:hypothetical protein